jgi:hypothetical protein
MRLSFNIISLLSKSPQKPINIPSYYKLSGNSLSTFTILVRCKRTMTSMGMILTITAKLHVFNFMMNVSFLINFVYFIFAWFCFFFILLCMFFFIRYGLIYVHTLHKHFYLHTHCLTLGLRN